MNKTREFTISFTDKNGVRVDKVVKIKETHFKLNMTPGHATSDEIWETTRKLNEARKRREMGLSSTTPSRPLYMYEPGRCGAREK